MSSNYSHEANSPLFKTHLCICNFHSLSISQRDRVNEWMDIVQFSHIKSMNYWVNKVYVMLCYVFMNENQEINVTLAIHIYNKRKYFTTLMETSFRNQT